VSGRCVLVTGGAGFIGSHVAEALIRAGDHVDVLDNFDGFYDPAIKRSNVADLLLHPRFTLFEGDIRDTTVLADVFAQGDYDGVIHLAARAGVRPSTADPGLYDSVNVLGTTLILEQIRLHRVPRLVFGSSSSVYGSTTNVPFSAAEPADRPSSPYASTKRASELACYAFHELYGTAITCLRFFTVYGPRQRPEMAIQRVR
jgi:UDP-glucuronate 4-epimerase